MVLTRRRARSATGTGTIAALLLVLIFGSPIYVDWAEDNADPETAGGWFLRLITWPAWRLSTSDDASTAVRDVFAADLRAILLVVLTAALLAVSATALLASERASFGAFMLGWGCFVFAAALAGLLTAFIASNASLLSAFQAAGGGAVYALFIGWVVGLAALAGRH